MCVQCVCVVCVPVCIQSLCLCFEDAPRYVRRQQSAVWAITKGQKPSTICELASLLSRFNLLLSFSLALPHSLSLSWCRQFVAWPATCLILYQIYNWLIGTWQWDYACQADLRSLSLSLSLLHTQTHLGKRLAWHEVITFITYTQRVLSVPKFSPGVACRGHFMTSLYQHCHLFWVSEF